MRRWTAARVRPNDVRTPGAWGSSPAAAGVPLSSGLSALTSGPGDRVARSRASRVCQGSGLARPVPAGFVVGAFRVAPFAAEPEELDASGRIDGLPVLVTPETGVSPGCGSRE